VELDLRQRSTAFSTISLAVTIALVIGTLLLLGPPGMASATTPCNVKNLATLLVYKGSGSNLQVAIDAADPGVTLRVKGVCLGTFTIGQDLSLAGATSLAYPNEAMLDGNALGSVLTVNGGTVAIRDLKITNGASRTKGGGISNAGSLSLEGSLVTANSAPKRGGGVFNTGTLTLTDAVVHRNTAGGNHCSFSFRCLGGGILNRGTLVLSGSSSVSANTTQNYGGGIWNGGILTVDGSSSVSGNAANENGGGIYNGSGGTVTLSGTSSVSRNTASYYGGGVVNDLGEDGRSGRRRGMERRRARHERFIFGEPERSQRGCRLRLRRPRRRYLQLQQRHPHFEQLVLGLREHGTPRGRRLEQHRRHPHPERLVLGERELREREGRRDLQQQSRHRYVARLVLG
jgi:hypothetical protein